MDIEKLIEAVKLCGSTPKVDQCKQCAYWSGGDMSKCIPRMTTAAATAISTLQAENEKLRVEAEGMRSNWYKSVEEIKKLRAEVESLKKGHCAGCSIPAVKAEQIRDLTDAPKLRAELEQVKRENSYLKERLHGVEKS